MVASTKSDLRADDSDSGDDVPGAPAGTMNAVAPPLILPAGYPRIRIVESFHELVTGAFTEGVNALCWPRTLPGDFREVMELIGGSDGMIVVDDAHLQRLPVSAVGRVAIEILLEDQRLLREHERDPVLEVVHSYPEDEDPGPVRTDVCSFHADSAPVEADTWLCTYYGASSEGLCNHEAIRRVDIPDTRATLLKSFGGKDDADFRAHLNECCYDLHYASVPGAKPFSFGVGNLWRIAVEWPGSHVPPCIHRAPDQGHGASPRLLLIS